MKYNITVQNNLLEIEIKQPTKNDINTLVELNAKWQLAALNGSTKQGFLSGVFNELFFDELIQNNAIMVAYYNNNIVAYMLTANHSNEGLLQVHKDEVAKLKTENKIEKNATVAVGIQTAVETAYHGSGLIVLIRNEFRALLKNRFQYLFTTIAKANERSFASATKYGWQVVGDDEHHYFLILNV